MTGLFLGRRQGKSWDLWCLERGAKDTPLIPRLYGVEEADVRHWREFLRTHLIAVRKIICESCGSNSSWLAHGLHVHEGIVKRNEISKSVPRWWELFSEYNCFILCGECHLNKGLPRAEFYGKAVDRYGKSTVDGWLESLPFRFTYEGAVDSPPESPADGSDDEHD